MTPLEPEGLVDLGNVTDAAPAVRDEHPPRRRTRTPRIVIAALVALSLLGAAAPPPRSLVTLVAEIAVGPYAQALVDGDRMYVDSYGERNLIVAYDLRSRRRLWSTIEVEQPPQNTLSLIGDVIVSSSYGAGGVAANTESFDVATGRRLWANPGSSAIETADGVLVQSPRLDGAPGGDLMYPSGYSLLDRRTGRVIWSVSVPAGCATVVGGATPPDTLAEACPVEGTVRTIDLADGRTRSERAAPLGGSIDTSRINPALIMVEPQIVIVGRTLLIAHMNVPGPTVDAYDLDSLATRWSGVDEADAQEVVECGEAICFYSTPDAGTRIDTLTGARLGAAVPMSLTTDPVGELRLAGADRRVESIPLGADGELISLSPDGTGTAWLENRSRTPIAALPRTGVSACELVRPYVVCATTDERVTVWRLDPSLRS
jgi:hypothetical protein